MIRIGAIAAALVMWAGSAAAQASADDVITRGDLRCILVLSMAQKLDDSPAVQQAAIAGVGFYMGRLKGRDPGVDMKVRLTNEAKLLNADKVTAELNRCGRELQDLGRETAGISDALKAIAEPVEGSVRR